MQTLQCRSYTCVIHLESNNKVVRKILKRKLTRKHKKYVQNFEFVSTCGCIGLPSLIVCTLAVILESNPEKDFGVSQRRLDLVSYFLSSKGEKVIN